MCISGLVRLASCPEAHETPRDSVFGIVGLVGPQVCYPSDKTSESPWDRNIWFNLWMVALLDHVGVSIVMWTVRLVAYFVRSRISVLYIRYRERVVSCTVFSYIFSQPETFLVGIFDLNKMSILAISRENYVKLAHSLCLTIYGKLYGWTTLWYVQLGHIFAQSDVKSYRDYRSCAKKVKRKIVLMIWAFL